MQCVNGSSNFMGKKKVTPKLTLRKNSNGMVWPQQQIPMHEVSIENNKHSKLKRKLLS